ncbi:hypothetical protein FOCC_FOCC015998 [Frankliniella occidentalis]|nr:hypothetical protein FOCC_FOCC015998 [Frankliniella occidentalis]
MRLSELHDRLTVSPRAPMPAMRVALVLALLLGHGGVAVRRRATDELPQDFIVGAGTSAYQSEGAWNVSGKGESNLDHMLHSDVISALVPNGDVAADSYHRYKEDVKAARDLKLQMYRFSLSWPRLLPTGHRSSLNPDGIRYYTDLLNELHSSGIKPMVTLVHFDHPVALQKEFGGWDDDRMIDAFVEYADIAFTYFGDKVQYWVTFNEPYVFCGAAGQMEFLAKAIVGVGVDPDGPVLPFGNRKTEPGADYNCLHRTIDFLGVNQYNGQVVADTRRPDYGSLQTDAAVDVLVNSLTGPRKDVEKTFTKILVNCKTLKRNGVADDTVEYQRGCFMALGRVSCPYIYY